MLQVLQLKIEVMLCRNSCGIALLTFVARNSKCFLQTRDSSKKIDKGKQFRKNKSEEKLLFGKLLETKKQKVKRLKLESSGKISKAIPSTADSEFAWVVQSSSQIKIHKQSNHKAKNVNNKINSSSNCDALKQCETNEEIEKKSTVKLDSSNQECLNSNLILNEKKNSLPSSKEEKKFFMEFPIFKESKNSSEQWADGSKILSIPIFENKLSINYPSVSKILSATMPEDVKAILEKWKNNMILKLGLKEFEIYQAELLNEGQLFHMAIMCSLTQKHFEISDKLKASLHSLTEVFKNIDKVRAVESSVVHPILKYKGKVDCIANYRDTLCLIDWKKSNKLKASIDATYDAPLQLVSYIGALNADLNYPFQIKNGLIVVAYTNGQSATVHEIDECSVQFYWKMWLQRLHEYHLLANG